MTLQLLHSEFSFKSGKLYFLFFQCGIFVCMVRFFKSLLSGAYRFQYIGGGCRDGNQDHFNKKKFRANCRFIFSANQNYKIIFFWKRETEFWSKGLKRLILLKKKRKKSHYILIMTIAYYPILVFFFMVGIAAAWVQDPLKLSKSGLA
jgi:hypothetical protein